MKDETIVEEAKKAILEATETPLEPPKKKRGRGRPRKQKSPEEAAREAKEERIAHWGAVGAGVVSMGSKIINMKWPGCGPSPDEIQSCQYSIGFILDDLFPDGDERSVHYTNVIAMLVAPTVLKIVNSKAAGGGGGSPGKNGAQPEKDEREKLT